MLILGFKDTEGSWKIICATKQAAAAAALRDIKLDSIDGNRASLGTVQACDDAPDPRFAASTLADDAGDSAARKPNVYVSQSKRRRVGVKAPRKPSWRELLRDAFYRKKQVPAAFRSNVLVGAPFPSGGRDA
ncbi:hypothetical protein J3R84_30490 (plasmid) [Ensifer canadensis]|nr:hypothetical protein J3R84_30490 [Ensifer canadensis]